MAPQNQLAIINSYAPYSDFNAAESLDLAMLTASYGLPVGLFFIGDGVLQLLKLDGDLVGRRQFHKGFAALELYDVEHVYVCQESLKKRLIEPQQLTCAVQLLAPQAMNQLLSRYDTILRF